MSNRPKIEFEMVDGVKVYDQRGIGGWSGRPVEPGYGATLVYDVSYLGYEVKRFNNVEDAVALAKDTDMCWRLLAQGFPNTNFEKGYNFQVNKNWSSILK